MLQWHSCERQSIKFEIFSVRTIHFICHCFQQAQQAQLQRNSSSLYLLKFPVCLKKRLKMCSFEEKAFLSSNSAIRLLTNDEDSNKNRNQLFTWSDKRTVLSVIAAAHWSLRMSRQMAPVTLEMFGCQIFVTKRTLGGLNGYVSGILISWNETAFNWSV